MLFWSKTKEIVHAFTEKRSCYVTLEDTLLGFLLDGLTWCGKNESQGTLTCFVIIYYYQQLLNKNSPDCKTGLTVRVCVCVRAFVCVCVLLSFLLAFFRNLYHRMPKLVRLCEQSCALILDPSFSSSECFWPVV